MSCRPTIHLLQSSKSSQSHSSIEAPLTTTTHPPGATTTAPPFPWIFIFGVPPRAPLESPFYPKSFHGRCLQHLKTKSNEMKYNSEAAVEKKSQRQQTKVRKAKTQVSVSKKKVKFKLKFGAIKNAKRPICRACFVSECVLDWPSQRFRMHNTLANGRDGYEEVDNYSGGVVASWRLGQASHGPLRFK